MYPVRDEEAAGSFGHPDQQSKVPAHLRGGQESGLRGCQPVTGNPFGTAQCHLCPLCPGDISVTNDLQKRTGQDHDGPDLHFLVELRGFEPLTPSMRTMLCWIQPRAPRRLQRHRRAHRMGAITQIRYRHSDGRGHYDRCQQDPTHQPLCWAVCIARPAIALTAARFDDSPCSAQRDARSKTTLRGRPPHSGHLPPGFLWEGSEQDVAEMFVPALKATSMVFRQCCDASVDTCEHRFARLVRSGRCRLARAGSVFQGA